MFMYACHLTFNLQCNEHVQVQVKRICTVLWFANEFTHFLFPIQKYMYETLFVLTIIKFCFDLVTR